MSIKEYLIEDLKLPVRILDYDVYANGRKIEPSAWSDFKVSPIDGVAITPYIGFLEIIHNIEAKIVQEVRDNYISAQLPCVGFLEPWEITTLENFYSMLQGRTYEKSVSFTSGTTSPNMAHYKFFVDQLAIILLENNIITSYNYELIGELISPSDSKGSYQDKLTKLNNGNEKGGFDLPEDTISKMYSEVWYEVNHKIPDSATRMSVFHKIDLLFDMQYNFYGYALKNPIYRGIRTSIYKLMKIVNEAGKILELNGEDPILSSYSKEKFSSLFHFKDNFDYYTNPDQIPYIKTFEDLGSKIIAEFDSRSLSFMNPIVESIIEEITSIIMNQKQVRDLIEGFPEGPKKQLISQIINCPDTDILTQVYRLDDLDYLLFNHPNYPHRDRASGTYIQSVYFSKNPKWQSIYILDSILHRVSQLEVSDFGLIGLDVSDSEIERLRLHTENVIYKTIQDYSINNYQMVGFSYVTKELRDIQLEAIRALWRAAAYHEEDFYLNYGDFCNTYEVPKVFYYKYVTKPGMIRSPQVMLFADKIDEFLAEEVRAISFSPYTSLINYPSITSEKSLISLEAKLKLLDYEKHRQEAIESWLKSDEDAKTWYNNLFAPIESGYAYGWNEPLYQAFSVSMGLLDLWGTDPISGISIPDAAFDASDPLRYARHHPDKDKMSLALYNQILTLQDQGIHKAYESMSFTQQSILKNGIRELIMTGIYRSESQARSGSNLDLFSMDNTYLYYTGVKQWITFDDFKKLFPSTLMFSFTYNGRPYKVNLLTAWEHVFLDGIDEKLFYINEKIQTFKDGLRDGDNPWLSVVEAHYPIAGQRFLEDAKIFATQFYRLIDKSLFTGQYTEKELAYRWHIYLMKRVFEI